MFRDWIMSEVAAFRPRRGVIGDFVGGRGFLLCSLGFLLAAFLALALFLVVTSDREV